MWEYRESVNELPGMLQTEVRTQIRQYAGTYDDPKLLTDDRMAKSTLKLGQAVYQKRCVQCHGVSGDGNGPVAQYLYPKPRDYRKGMFKFTSTPFGSRPQKADLVRTIRQGIHGTSMPAFKLLPEAEIDAVVDYVLVLTQRGEVEEQITVMAEQEDEVDPELIADDVIPFIVSRWEQSQQEQIAPLTPQPVFTRRTHSCGERGVSDPRLCEVSRRGRSRDDSGQPQGGAERRVGQPHAGRRSHVGDAPRWATAHGHLSADLRWHQRHADARFR